MLHSLCFSQLDQCSGRSVSPAALQPFRPGPVIDSCFIHFHSQRVCVSAHILFLFSSVDLQMSSFSADTHAHTHPCRHVYRDSHVLCTQMHSLTVGPGIDKRAALIEVEHSEGATYGHLVKTWLKSSSTLRACAVCQSSSQI